MKSLGLAVITFNEEKHIEQVLNSVPFASQKVVVDSFSTDKTIELASKCGAKVVKQEWLGYSKQKQLCLEQLSTDWILVLDGDEWLSSDLQQEIENLLESTPIHDGYYLKRHQVFLKRELKHGRGVDRQLRLIKRGKGRYNDREIHEEIIVEGSVGELKAHIVHHSSLTISDELEKLHRDTNFELKYFDDTPISMTNLFLKPFIFWFVMMLKGTWRDGVPGVIFLTMTAYKYFILGAKKYEKDLGIK